MRIPRLFEFESLENFTQLPIFRFERKIQGMEYLECNKNAFKSEQDVNKLDTDEF